jgi:hypothetical protein
LVMIIKERAGIGVQRYKKKLQGMQLWNSLAK